MKIIGLIGLAVLLLPVSNGFATDLKVGLYENEPKIFTDAEGHSAGIFVDIFNEIARQEGWNVQYVPCEWVDCLDSLKNGIIDLMPDLAITEERSRHFSFHTNAVAFSWLQVYRSPDVTVNSLLELSGLRVAILQGSVQETVFRKMADEFGLHCDIIPVAEMHQAFQMVADGMADVAIVNHFFGNYHRYQYQLVQTPIVFQPDKLYFATRIGEHSNILATIDRYMETWRNDPGSYYQDVLTRWIGEKPRVSIPAYVWWMVGGIALMLVFSRWQVMHRTRELHLRNKHLQEVLAELSMLHYQAMQQERLKALGQMVSGIAHDFNNILTMIIGHVHLLKDSLPSDPKSAREESEQLEIIMKAAMDGASMVQRMREFAHSPNVAPTFAQVRLDELIQDVVDLSRPRWETQSRSAGLAIRLHTDLVEVPPVKGSPSELREALLNLIFNALDAMPKGGDLTLKCYEQDNGVIIRVTDTGIGMSEKVRENCLHPFFTTKDVKGTGMGLTMVASVMERHQGQLEIESREGEGTSFILTFPVRT